MVFPGISISQNTVNTYVAPAAAAAENVVMVDNIIHMGRWLGDAMAGICGHAGVLCVCVVCLLLFVVWLC